MLKTFPLADVLSVTTERLVCDGVDRLYSILNHMTGDNLFTHQLPRASEECKPWLLRWFPELANVRGELLGSYLARFGTQSGIRAWIDEAISLGCKTEYEIGQIPRDDHEQKDPIAELREMCPDKPIIVV